MNARTEQTDGAPKGAPSLAPRRLLIPVLGIGGVFIALTVFLVGWAIWQGRTDAHRAAEIATTNLSRTLADNFTSSINKIDLSLLAIRDEVIRQHKLGREDEAALRDAIARQDERHPHLAGFRIFGPDGKLRIGLRDIANRNATLAGGENFEAQRLATADNLVVGAPLFGPATQQWTIAVSRRITNPDGSFGGMVLTPIAAHQLAQNFGSLDLGKNGTVALYHSNFILAARYPEPTGPNNPIGTAAISDKLRAIVASGAPLTQYDYNSVVDGVRRTASVRKVEGLPYFMLVGQSEEHYLADWRRNSLYLALFGAVVVSFVLLGMALIHRRVSDRLRATAILAESEEKLRGLFDLSPLGIARNTLDGHFVEFNEAFRAITGYEDHELREMDYWTLTPRQYEAEELRQVEALTATGRYGPYRKEYMRKDGSHIPVQLTGMLVTGHDGQPYIWSLVEDVSDSVAAEAAMRAKTELLIQSNADLEQFAYVASHDLQTPLRNMVSYAQLLDRRYRGRLDNDADDFIGFIVASSKQMTQLITDLLEYSRVASQDRQLRGISAEPPLLAAIANLKRDMERIGASITTGPMPEVMAESSLLVSLFQNLLGNGLKYHSPHRKPELSVTAERISTEFWRFAVTDNGIGIESSYHAKIFEIFQRLHPDATTSGTGIGLTLCRRIVLRLGGSIWLDSAPDQGTTFYFTLRDGAIAATATAD